MPFLAYEPRFYYLPALSQKVMASGSVHLSSLGCERMDSDSDSIEDDDVEIENGSDSSSSSQLGRLVVMDALSNE